MDLLVGSCLLTQSSFPLVFFVKTAGLDNLTELKLLSAKASPVYCIWNRDLRRNIKAKMTLDETLLAWTNSEKDWEDSLQDLFWSSGSATGQINLGGSLSNWADRVKEANSDLFYEWIFTDLLWNLSKISSSRHPRKQCVSYLLKGIRKSGSQEVYCS